MMNLRFVANLGLVILAILLMPTPIIAHGVEGRVQPGGVCVAYQYGSGELMEFAKVTVHAPGADKPFQVGHTDKNGRFCFFPDLPGDWRVTAEDGMGHRLEVIVPVTPEQVQGKQVNTAPPSPGISFFERALVGLSLIFGLAGLLFYWRARKVKT